VLGLGCQAGWVLGIGVRVGSAVGLLALGEGSLCKSSVT
jgi:hypothetical protein